MIKYCSHKPLPPVLTYGEVETCCSGVNGVRGFLDFAVAFRAVSIRAACIQAVLLAASCHHSVPQFTSDMWLGSWALYLPGSTGRHQHVHAVVGVSAFYRRSGDPQFWKTRALGTNICRQMKLVSQPSPQLCS